MGGMARCEHVIAELYCLILTCFVADLLKSMCQINYRRISVLRSSVSIPHRLVETGATALSTLTRIATENLQNPTPNSFTLSVSQRSVPHCNVHCDLNGENSSLVPKFFQFSIALALYKIVKL